MGVTDDADGLLVRVSELIAEVLPDRRPAAPGLSLREAGLSSLPAVRLSVELQDAFGIEIPLARLAECTGPAELVAWISAGSPPPAAATEIVNHPEETSFACTPLQQSYLMGKNEAVTDDPAGCHIYREFEVPGLDPDRLRDAWSAVVAAQPMLRTRIGADGRQQVMEQAPVWTMPVHRSADGPALEHAVRTTRERLSHRLYEPGVWPMFSVAVNQGPGELAVVHLSIDALLSDGTGLELMLAWWWQAYTDPQLSLPRPGVSVEQCLDRLRPETAAPARDADLAWWRGQLAAMPGGPDVLAGQQPAPEPDGRCHPRTPRRARLGSAEWQSLMKLSDTLGVSPSSLVLAAFADSLRTHSPDPVFALLLTTNDRGRLPAEAADLVGPFTASVVLLVNEPEESGVPELATALHARLWQGLGHSRVGAVEVLRDLRRSRPVPELPVVFTSLLGTGYEVRKGTFADSIGYAVSQTTGLALDLQIAEDDGGLELHLDSADGMLRPGLPQALFAELVNGLRMLAANPTANSPVDGFGDDRRPLNDLQRAYFVSRMTQTGPWDGCQVAASFPVQNLDPDRLARSWLKMVRTHDALRTVVTRDGDLRVLPGAPSAWEIPVIRGDDADPGAGGALLPGLVSSPFRLDRWPQSDLRVTTGGGPVSTVHLTLDLVTCDGRSVHRLLRELFRGYADPSAEPVPADPAGPAVSGAGRAEAVRHWEQRLEGMPSGPALPMVDAVGGEPARVRLSGSVPGWRSLNDLAEQRGTHPDALLTAVLNEVLGQYFPKPFAIPLVRWTEATEAARPGEFTALSWIAHDRTVPTWQRAGNYHRIIAEDTAADAVSGLTELRRRVLRHRREGEFGYPVVRTGLLRLADHRLPEGVGLGPWLTCTPDVSMDCIDMDSGDDELLCFWDVTVADFADGVPAALFGAYLARLEQLVAEATGARPAGPAEPAEPEGPRPGTPLGPDEIDRIVNGWNDTEAEYPVPGPIHVLFERQVQATPDAVAVMDAGAVLTYAGLNRRANALAWRLRDLGVGPGDFVAITVCRGIDMAVAVLGVLKSGGAYLPVDPRLPGERAHGMLADAGAVALVSGPGQPGWQVPAGLARLGLTPAEEASESRSGTDPEPVSGPDDSAYVIYTSGSTGRPKGVLVTHRPLHNLFNWCRKTFRIGPGDVGICVTSLGFDLSVFDLLGLLGVGASLYIADEAEQKDPELLVEVLRRERVTFWNSAPTTLHQLVPFFPGEGEPIDSLRLVFLSGDYTRLSLPPALWASFPNARLISLGGATEATVWSNWFPVDRIDPSWRSIPYGRPIDNSRYHVLDEQLRPLPPGQEGDLYIGGVCLSQGYLNRPDLNRERFIGDPFRPGERLYRTGDRASYFTDGVICFLGRVDHQVKVRGFRIELGEIEHALRGHPAVTDAVLLAHPDPSGDRKLVAYVIATSPVTAGQLRAHVAGVLPEYMVPNHVAFLDRFPATGNGKLDREALPWPLTAAQATARIAEPAEESGDPGALDPAVVVRELTDRFAELLGLPVDPAEDLWDQGATSFTMVQVSMAIRNRYGRRIPVATLLETPTVAGIAQAVSGRAATVPEKSAPPPPAPVEFFDPESRDTFYRQAANLRAEPPVPGIRLPAPVPGPEQYLWRRSHREFVPGPLPLEALARLLALLSPAEIDGKPVHLYPSAGHTYAVQVYLHVPGNGVAGLEPGVYYHRAAGNLLERVGRGSGLDRSLHFVYNREPYDGASFQIFLIGQRRGVAPLYPDDAGLFLALEAGYLGGLLMSGQAATGIGLCPIGSVAGERLPAELDLDDGHEFLAAFLGGPLDLPVGAASYSVPPFAVPRQVPGAAPAAGDEHGPADPVAVIGLSARMPGSPGLEGFWSDLVAGRQSLRPIPESRSGIFDARDRARPGGYLDHLGEVPSMAFGIAPREAAGLDPQSLLLFEALWRCAEDAAMRPGALGENGRRVGVYVASMWPDHHLTGADQWRSAGLAQQSGIASDLPNRISHALDLRGPSIAVNTSCSSSLTALHLAIEGLRRGETDLAVVAGVNVVSHPYHLALLRDLGLLGHGHGAAYAADDSGWHVGEGVGAMILRRDGEARRDGDHRHGVIEETWTGHSGRTPRFPAPSAPALAASLRQLLGRARLGPDDIDYVEAAAAGAGMADAAEITALEEVFAGRAGGPVPIGTVKPNIGHLEAASGLSQLIKVMLQFRHATFAPTVLAEERNPLVSWDPRALRVQDRVAPWPVAPGRPRRALVNAVGATGSYAHTVITDGGGAP